MHQPEMVKSSMLVPFIWTPDDWLDLAGYAPAKLGVYVDGRSIVDPIVPGVTLLDCVIVFACLFAVHMDMYSCSRDHGAWLHGSSCLILQELDGGHVQGHVLVLT